MGDATLTGLSEHPHCGVLELAAGGRVAGEIDEVVVAGQLCLQVQMDGTTTIHPPGSWSRLTLCTPEVARIIADHPERLPGSPPNRLQRGHASSTVITVAPDPGAR